MHVLVNIGHNIPETYAANVDMIHIFSKFLQHSVARAGTVPSNPITEGFEFCSLIGSHSWCCCNQKLQELGKMLYTVVMSNSIITYMITAIFIPTGNDHYHKYISGNLVPFLVTITVIQSWIGRLFWLFEVERDTPGGCLGNNNNHLWKFSNIA